MELLYEILAFSLHNISNIEFFWKVTLKSKPENAGDSLSMLPLVLSVLHKHLAISCNQTSLDGKFMRLECKPTNNSFV